MADISHNYIFDIDGLIQIQFTDVISISETDVHISNLDFLTQTQPLEQALFIQQHLFTDVADLSQAQSINSIILNTIFDIDELSQAQPLASVNLGAEFDMDSLNQAQPLETVTVIRNVVYNVDELLQPSQTLGETDVTLLIHSFTSAISNINVQALSVNVPSDASTDDFLLAILATDGAGETHTADGAWTTVEDSLDSGGHTLSVYKRTVTGTPEPSSYNFTWTTDEKAVGVILLIRGASLNPLQVKAKLTGRSKTPIGLAVTPNNSENLYLSINTHDQAGGNFYDITYPTGLFNEVNVGAGPQSGVAIQIGSKFISDTTTEPLKTWVMSKKDNWYTLSLLIAPPGPFVIGNINQAQLLDTVVVAED